MPTLVADKLPLQVFQLFFNYSVLYKILKATNLKYFVVNDTMVQTGSKLWKLHVLICLFFHLSKTQQNECVHKNKMQVGNKELNKILSCFKNKFYVMLWNSV